MAEFSKYFRLEEFLDSSVARQKGISNSPSWEVVESLRELAIFLDDVRAAWKSGIIVNSGFRCKKLNDDVGGVYNSAHLKAAADLYPANGKFDEFKKFIVAYLKDKKYDECIIEKKGKSQWVHFALRSINGEQRRKCFSLNVT